MKKRIVVTVVLAVLMATCAQKPTDFFELLKTGTPQSVQAAISKGADVNALNSANDTPLMYAAMYNPNPEVITMLLKAGANIEARDPYGLTPLMFAANYNPKAEVVTTLLKAGADMKVRDPEYGGTPRTVGCSASACTAAHAFKSQKEKSEGGSV